jgi:hypothetical protein|tara:strand:- start:179 stop:397 length:219 start_codon:yes stop_codon:yes gene_type:complete
MAKDIISNKSDIKFLKDNMLIKALHKEYGIPYDRIYKMLQTKKDGGMVNKNKSKKARGQGITKKKTKFKGIF